jgi:lipopolysaccharide biosynthesis protein
MPRPRVLAFYLPQFHPFPENDEWWGKGFTEWRNVTRGRPQFLGHYQPHLPADLGFYDLRLPEVREAQATLAREHGIDGFCYYHYWFHGKRLMERVFDEVLASGKPDFPFCLCWANEHWTRAWDGRDRQIIQPQAYSDEDHVRHARWLAAVFRDPRYVRVNGKPLFLVYRTRQIPDPQRFADTLREEAAKAGVGELLLAKVESWTIEHSPPQEVGFDVAVEFQPNFGYLGKKLFLRSLLGISRLVQSGWAFARHGHLVFDYRMTAEKEVRKAPPGYPWFRCVTPAWDNTARRQRGAVILSRSTPNVYEWWLREVLRQARDCSATGEQVVFLNAWNEWAEGNHLEPDLRYGHAYLQATKRAIESFAPAITG